jgi:hypothetical protein
MNSTAAARLAQLAADVHAARVALDEMGQNEFARQCGVDPAVLSKLVRAKVLAAPSEKKIRAFLHRNRHRLVAREKVSA